jgi:hypothetical protein
MPKKPTEVNTPYFEADPSRETYPVIQIKDTCMTEKLCDATRVACHVRYDSMETALNLRASELDRRLEATNRLREEVTKDREDFVRVNIYDAKHESVLISINNVQEMVARLATRLTIIETRSITWTLAVGFFFVVLQIAIALWRHT